MIRRNRARAGLVRGGLLALAGAVGLSGCSFQVYDLPLPGGADTGDDPMTVTVQFTDVLDLVPQSSVKVNDVSVGKVTDVRLDGYLAEVDLEVRNDVELPDNAVAKIRQTSLLGEKFVDLAAPETGASSDPLESGDVIPLERAGRNPEIEEVFGALSLVLNGGGVAQLKTITVELNKALEGREGAAKSVLTQLDTFVGTLDEGKADIVAAIESLNRLSVQLNEQEGTIEAALDELPSAIRSVDGQRRDLVRMLTALQDLSDVGVRVINASKDSTIASLRSLGPVLREFADSGEDFANAINVYLTYPFVDETVGRDPQVARSLEMGDYTNLAIQLDLDLVDLVTNPPGLPDECVRLAEIPENGTIDLTKLCQGALAAVQDCLQNPSAAACGNLPGAVLNTICDSVGPLQGVCGTGGGGDGGGGGGGGLPDIIPDLPSLPGLGSSSGLLGALMRPAPGGAAAPAGSSGPLVADSAGDLDPVLASLLLPGMVIR